jgi:ribosomal protein L37AE/L43A
MLAQRRFHPKGRSQPRKRVRESRPIRLYLSVKIALENQCPVCGSRDIRPSRKTGLLTVVLHRLSLDIDRCRQCHHRFLLPRTQQTAGHEQLTSTAANSV